MAESQRISRVPLSFSFFFLSFWGFVFVVVFAAAAGGGGGFVVVLLVWFGLVSFQSFGFFFFSLCTQFNGPSSVP